MSPLSPPSLPIARGRRPGARIARGLAYTPLILFAVAAPLAPLAVVFPAPPTSLLEAVVTAIMGAFMGLVAFTLLLYTVVYTPLEALRALYMPLYLALSAAASAFGYWAAWRLTGWSIPFAEELPAGLAVFALLATLDGALFWWLSKPILPEFLLGIHRGPRRWVGPSAKPPDAYELYRIAASMTAAGFDHEEIVTHLENHGVDRVTAVQITDSAR